MITKCLDAYKNLNVQIEDNSVAISPCCIIPGKPAETIEFQNNSFLNEIRDHWDTGIPHYECTGCIRYKHSNQWYKDHGYDNNSVELIRLDYWVGNVCNLRCAICGPKSSSAWVEELKLPIVLRKNIVNQTWKNIDLNQLKFVHFNGGEPLLSKEHVKFLESIPIKKQVYINYNTNGTILPTADLLLLWSKFKLVQIDFSIDDIGDRFEYQRYPAKWDHVVKNLQWYIDNAPVNCMFNVNTTVSVLNQNNLANLKLWLDKNFSTNRVTDPIEQRIQNATGLLAVGNTDKKKIVDFLNACDQRRGTNWQTTFPELKEQLS